MREIVISNFGVGLHLRSEDIQWLKNHGCSDDEIESFENNREHPTLIEYIRTVNPRSNGFALYSIFEYDESTHKPKIVPFEQFQDWFREDVELFQMISRKKIFEFILNNDMMGLDKYLESLDHVVVVD